MYGFRTCETSGRCPSRALRQHRLLHASPPVRAKPPDPRGALPIRARDHVRGAQPRGPVIPLAIGRRSHAGGSSTPLRSAPRRGASRGWGFEGALRRTAMAPVVARTVSHGSEPWHIRARPPPSFPWHARGPHGIRQGLGVGMGTRSVVKRPWFLRGIRVSGGWDFAPTTRYSVLFSGQGASSSPC